MTAPEFVFDPKLVSELDPAFIDQMAGDLGITRREVRRCLRDGIAAGLLSIAATKNGALLRGEFPADLSDADQGAR